MTSMRRRGVSALNTRSASASARSSSVAVGADIPHRNVTRNADPLPGEWDNRHVGILRELRAAVDRNAQAIDRNTQAFEDLRVVIRESRILEERALQSFERSNDRVAVVLEDFRSDLQAHTQAI